MSNISEHFSRKEFACRCGCGFDTADAELVRVLEELRAHFQRPVSVTSGSRCRDYNKKIGGASRSQHTLGKAADISVTGVVPKDVYLYLDKGYPDRYGLGDGTYFTHIDVRTEKARWNYE
jgi:uncharacterized protein YcbK (DUF882 family)